MRVAFGIAAAAAAIATVGDLLMLWVANALRPELRLSTPSPGLLQLGALLGVTAIPLYGIGWAAAAARAAPALGRAAPWVMLAGGIGAVVGAYIHAATAWLIEGQMRSGTPAGAPLESVLDAGAGLVVPWGVATVAALVASGAIAWAARRGVVPRGWIVANPAVATVLVAAVGAASELGRAFLVPAAPNVAHLVFFTTAFRSSGRR
jgi:hypothetical protein